MFDILSHKLDKLNTLDNILFGFRNDLKSRDTINKWEGGVKFWEGLDPWGKLSHRNRMNLINYKLINNGYK